MTDKKPEGERLYRYEGITYFDGGYERTFVEVKPKNKQPQRKKPSGMKP